MAPALFEEEDAVGAVLAEFVASLLNESALTMEPLGSAVDLDALVTLLRNAESRVEVGFPYEPLYVTVSSTGLVTAEVVDG
ncbi:HalOD1 output domain-containing protein [Halomarina litorea]|uniref:HalOD1 output domain-containing protein n=1 Tax=Halomarina litorea TaxID=2961595 RepID=UPI0020C3017F|nr:HalOD1 output domain-containing protein [Halomarina sp. BCD28]